MEVIDGRKLWGMNSPYLLYRRIGGLRYGPEAMNRYVCSIPGIEY
jgi:hypothetical protein